MGYDMSTRGTIPGEAEALAALNGPYTAALAARDARMALIGREAAQGSYQEGIDADKFLWGGTFANADPEYAAAQAEVMRLSDEQDKARRSYFRLNVWGMARYRDVMEAVGMGFWAEHPAWPDAEEFGFTTREHGWAAQEVMREGNGDLAYDHGYEGVTVTEDDLEKAKRWQAAVDNVRSAHPAEIPGIPLVKFTSNDGWVVTPAECRSALELFGRFIAAGYAMDPRKEHDLALSSYRKADDAERKIVAGSAMVLNAKEDGPVGHPPFSADEGTQATVLDVITEPYFLQWLTYLEDAATVDGFEVW